MTSKVTYTGNLRTVCEHIKSKDNFVTDAPTDNNGLGEAFSPTDTVATALASCILTVMGIKAQNLDVVLKNATAEVTKYMASAPRRISKIGIALTLPASVSDTHRKILEHTAHTCPVHHSLHPNIHKEITFNWVL